MTDDAMDYLTEQNLLWQKKHADAKDALDLAQLTISSLEADILSLESQIEHLYFELDTLRSG